MEAWLRTAINQGLIMITVNKPMHIFDTAIALKHGDEGQYKGQTSPNYANMVGPFGGIIGATLLNAIIQHPLRLGDPLSLTVHFSAPIADGAFSVEAKAVRTNRSTQHWYVELIQGEQVAAFATVVTALRRDTWNQLDAIFPQVTPAADIDPMPSIPSAIWTSCYEMKFISGFPGRPSSASNSSESLLWMRDQPARPLDFLSLSALCDAFFPRIFVRRPKPVPIGTVAMTTYFHADAVQLAEQGDAPVLGIARARNFSKGYFDQTAEIWSTSGNLLATTHQIVYFKE